MPDSARLTDEWAGVCCCHKDPPCPGMGGWIISACSKTDSASQGQARISSITVGYCGHTGEISTGSGKGFCNVLGMARIGDFVSGCNIGEVITGAPKHIIGG